MPLEFADRLTALISVVVRRNFDDHGRQVGSVLTTKLTEDSCTIRWLLAATYTTVCCQPVGI